MLETILSAVGVFVATSIDYLVILTLIFAQDSGNQHKAAIYAGQYLGTGILVGVSLLAAYVVNFLPEDWLVGLLGLIPIFLGIRQVTQGEEDGEADESLIDQLEQNPSRQVFWTISLLTISSGGDNLGVYLPYFASLGWQEIVVALFVFVIGIVILCELSQKLSETPFISQTVEKYERVLVPVVLVILGFYIMFEAGTLQKLLSMIV